MAEDGKEIFFGMDEEPVKDEPLTARAEDAAKADTEAAEGPAKEETPAGPEDTAEEKKEDGEGIDIIISCVLVADCHVVKALGSGGHH